MLRQTHIAKLSIIKTLQIYGAQAVFWLTIELNISYYSNKFKQKNFFCKTKQ